MNKRVYLFLRRYLIKEDANGMFAKLLTAEEIKDFICKTYEISVSKVERIEFPQKDAEVFKFYGVYLHSGFNNIPFEGVFLAKDYSYEIRTSLNILSINREGDWKNFMSKRFGRKYVRMLKKNLE